MEIGEYAGRGYDFFKAKSDAKKQRSIGQIAGWFMAITREYVSPDSQLRFVIFTHDDGDVSLGFDGFAWHTHADLLASVKDVSCEEAVEQFVHDLLNNRLVIAVSTVGGKIRSVSVTDDPTYENKYQTEGESIELRYWDGSKWSDSAAQ